MGILEGVSLVVGTTGAVLGVINTISNYQRDRLNIRVRPVWLISTVFPRHCLGINIVNRGFQAVTISGAGFLYRDKSKLVIPDPMVMPSGSLPYRLEPRAGITVFSDKADVTEWDNFDRATQAFAVTACDTVFRGKSAALTNAIGVWRENQAEDASGAAERRFLQMPKTLVVVSGRRPREKE